MLTEERWQHILNILHSNGIVSVSELSKRLNTTEVTIRRDLSKLEQEGRLKRTHGGAIRNDHSSGTYFEPLFSQLEIANAELKTQITRKAFDLVSDSTAIIIDSSSTAKQLCQLIRMNPPSGLMVVTNSVRVVLDLSICKSVEVILIGGQVRSNLISCTGPLTELLLDQLRVDKAFIGINGIDFKDNVLTTPNISEAAIKTSMMKCAKEIIILADHTKFNKTYLCKVCNVTDVDTVITDNQVDPAIVEEAKDCGVSLLIAD